MRAVSKGAGREASAGAGTIAVLDLCESAEMLRRLGFDGYAMLDQAGVTAAIRAAPHARVPALAEHVFWETAERVTRDPAIGLRVGVEHALHGRYSLLEYLAANSPTLGQALEIIQRVVALVDDRGHVELSARGSLAQLAVYRDGLPRARGYMDGLIAHFVTAYGSLVPNFRLRELAFRQPRPRVVRPYVRLFGLEPSFDAPRNQLAFDRELLDVRISNADPDVRELLWEHAQHLLSALPTDDPLLDAARRAISRGLLQGEIEADKIARELGMSARTLRRRLAELGASYQTLLDDLRGTLASAELRHGGASVEELAQRLRFSSRTAFQRAFRRYTGMSPSEYRSRFGARARFSS